MARPPKDLRVTVNKAIGKSWSVILKILEGKSDKPADVKERQRIAEMVASRSTPKTVINEGNSGVVINYVTNTPRPAIELTPDGDGAYVLASKVDTASSVPINEDEKK